MAAPSEEAILDITELQTLRAKRGARKGAITRIKSYYDNASKMELDKVSLPECLKKREQLGEQAHLFEVIQERISELASSDAIFAEESEVNKQFSSIEELVSGIDHLYLARQAYSDATSVLRTLADIRAFDSALSRSARSKRDEMDVLIKRFQLNMDTVSDIVTLRKLRDRVDAESLELYNRVSKEEAAVELRAAATAHTDPPTIMDPPAAPTSSFPSRLRIDLPSFNGDIMTWKPFWHLYQARLKKEVGLDDFERINCLQSCLKDPAANKLFTASSVGGEYECGVKALQEAYDQERLVFKQHVHNVLSLPHILGNHSDIVALRQKMRDTISGMKDAKGLTAMQILTAIAERSFDRGLRSRWDEFTAELDSPPDMECFMAFLDKRAKSTFSQALQLKEDQPMPSRSKPADIKPKPQQHKVKVMQSIDVPKDPTCPHCDGAHRIYDCDSFKSLTAEQRADAARQKRLCFNCLGKGHGVARCHSKHTCRECSAKHHSLLHKSATTITTSDLNDFGRALFVNNSQRRFAKYTIPRTILATVSVDSGQQVARALMDPGASLSLVTSRLAASLKAKRIRSPTDIAGIGGGLQSSHRVELTLRSTHCPNDESLVIIAQVVQDITTDYPLRDLTDVHNLPCLKGLPLADREFGRSGKIDLLLGIADCNLCLRDDSVSSPHRCITAQKTLFGWALGGAIPGDSPVQTCLKATDNGHQTDLLLQQFWEMEKVPGEDCELTPDQKLAVDHFSDTHSRAEDGRFMVKLPRPQLPPPLGNSRAAAVRRYLQTEKSLTKQGRWQDFSKAVEEYAELRHAELVPAVDLQKPCNSVFYLPMHGVVKEASTTTKLRIVFDASAATTTGYSLNDTLLPGPSLLTSLPSILTRFRLPRIGMSADVSKMFREICLHPDERDYHRFLRRSPNGDLEDWRMLRLTFGVTASPFLASQVLSKMAQDHSAEYPLASYVVLNQFYVDDCLTGADTPEAAAELRSQLNALLSRVCMTLRKWRTNSSELQDTIPPELLEKDDLRIATRPADCSKALGVHWNTAQDTLHVSVPQLESQSTFTKRQLASAVAKAFDILGWYAPVTIALKILLQKLWLIKIGWDDDIPAELKDEWEAWRSELHLITEHPIPRRITTGELPVVGMQLHGFCDASESAFGGVVYLRTFYSDTSVTVTLITAKSRVAPVSGLTIPRLELNGAVLLSKMLVAVASDLDIPIEQVYTWCDSTVVLGWLNSSSVKFKVYVGHRVKAVTELVPASHWRYVATNLNPADLVSRGVKPKELMSRQLWWAGPPWLSKDPGLWPKRPDLNLSRELPELRLKVLVAKPVVRTHDLLNRYSNFDRLLRSTAWIRRFCSNCRGPKELAPRLTNKELEDARLQLLKLCQEQAYGKAIMLIRAGKELSKPFPLLPLRPLIGFDGLLRVGGRLEHSKESYFKQHPVILPANSPITALLVQQAHHLSNHAGPSAMIGILADTYYITGIKKLVKVVSRRCVPCQRAYAKTLNQMMGQLPSTRTTPAAPFSIVGLDYAGPFQLKRGNPRKPTLVKAYVCVYICFTTKAIHLELVSDMTTDAFIACFCRFTARRGCPAQVYSDNGSNFVGAERELRVMQELVRDDLTRQRIHHLSSERNIQWNFSPSRAPHFGGIWEAGVKSMKLILRKVVGPHHLNYEEFTTILAEAEATLNSRPLIATYSTTEDGVPPMTPGHFLIGRPLKAPPVRVDSCKKITALRRWNLLNRLYDDLWTRWRSEYLHHLQARKKWHHPMSNLRKGDVVLLKEDFPSRRSWPLGIVTNTFPGQDGLTRVAEITVDGHSYKRPVNKLVLLITEKEEDEDQDSHFFPGEDVRACDSVPPVN